MIFVGIVLIAASAVIGGVGAARACGGVSMAAAGMAALTAGVQTLMMALASALIIKRPDGIPSGQVLKER